MRPFTCRRRPHLSQRGLVCVVRACSSQQRPQRHPGGSADAPPDYRAEEQPHRTLYPKVKLVPDTLPHRSAVTGKPRAFQEPDEELAANGPSLEEQRDRATLLHPGGEPPQHQEHALSTSTAAAADRTSTAVATEPTGDSMEAANARVHDFLAEAQYQTALTRQARNQSIPYPEHPDNLVPEFRRLRRHTRMEVTPAATQEDYPTFVRRDAHLAVPLPPPAMHPWTDRPTPIGPFITHGDGQINIRGGTGEVGFDDKVSEDGQGPPPPLPRHWRGLQHRSVLQHRLPQRHGRVLQDAVVRRSFEWTGRGIFATRPIKKGEIIMIVRSTAQNVGVKGELRRLEELVIDILNECYDEQLGLEEAGLDSGAAASTSEKRSAASSRNADGGGSKLDFLHDWILTGQPSSLLEHWPAASTQRVLEGIGGEEVLSALELHRNHIARIAAIVDLNSFLVESFYAERKGMAYFPEAGFLNHSCAPNTTYDIMPEHTFAESEYYLEDTLETAESQPQGGGGGAGEPPSGHGHGTPTTPADDDDVGQNRSDNSAVPTRRDTPAVDKEHDAVSEAQQAEAPESQMTPYHDMTEDGAPRYLFCCRATEDIASGTELTISYVPPEWSFDNRQYVLHDRYRFWCKCPKCSPTLDSKYMRSSKGIVVMLIIAVVLQLIALYQRDRRNERQNIIDSVANLDEEERVRVLREKGMDMADYRDALEQQRIKKRKGLLERLEANKADEVYTWDTRDNPVSSDFYTRAPR